MDNYQGHTLMLTLHQTQTSTILLLLTNIQLDISYDPPYPMMCDLTVLRIKTKYYYLLQLIQEFIN